MLFAVQQLREARNSDKEERLSALEKSDCVYYCQYRLLCLQAYRMHVRGLRKIIDAQLSREHGMAEPKERAQDLLVEAEQELTQARQQVIECVAQGAELKRQSNAR